jgi:hypothetical protein
MESSYPNGDISIPIEPLGALLLFAHSNSKNPKVATQINLHSSAGLTMHQRLVDTFLDDARFNVIDAILLLGMNLEKTITKDDLPSFGTPDDPKPTKFLEYLQVFH